MNTAVSASELAADVPAGGLLGWAERGWLPDPLLRLGIRRMCAQRLAEESAGGPQAQSARMQRQLAAGFIVVAIGLGATAFAAGLATAWMEQAWLWGLGGAVVGVLVYGLIASYAELIRLVTDMLMPK